MAEISNRWL